MSMRHCWNDGHCVLLGY